MLIRVYWFPFLISAASGGAVSLETKSTGIFLTNSSFVHNQATGAGGGGQGGAVYASTTQSLMIRSATVVNNIAAASGGGIFVQNAAQTVVQHSVYIVAHIECVFVSVVANWKIIS